VRPGGLIVLDNVLWSGAVADPAVDDLETRILRAVSQKILDDERVHACILTVGDGVLLAQKR
jgi:predicted O-methyltransferase YrrM